MQYIFRFRYLVTSGRDTFRNMLRGAALLFTSCRPTSRGIRLIFRVTPTKPAKFASRNISADVFSRQRDVTSFVFTPSSSKPTVASTIRARTVGQTTRILCASRFHPESLRDDRQQQEHCTAMNRHARGHDDP